MDKIELVCVSCQQVDPGTGIWSVPPEPPGDHRKESLCPDCCYHRFPQFYSDYQQQPKPRQGFRGLLSSVAGLLRS